MKAKKEKGDRTYMSSKRRKELIYTFVFALVGILIFLIGYYLNKKSNANIFTILAVLMVLPGAKMLTGVIVLAPFHDADEKEERAIREIMPEDSLLLSSVVFTSPEKVMNLDFLWIGDGHVYGCLGKEKQDLNYMQAYLSKGVHNYADHVQVKIVKNTEELKRLVKTAKAKECGEDERKAVKEYILSLIV
jgi:hypothetical protein